MQIRGRGWGEGTMKVEQKAEETGMDLALSGRLDHTNTFWNVFKTGSVV